MAPWNIVWGSKRLDHSNQWNENADQWETLEAFFIPEFFHFWYKKIGENLKYRTIFFPNIRLNYVKLPFLIGQNSQIAAIS